MRVVATSDGLTFVLTYGEQEKIRKAVQSTPFTGRAVIERLAEVYSANLDEDVNDVLEYLEAGD